VCSAVDVNSGNPEIGEREPVTFVTNVVAIDKDLLLTYPNRSYPRASRDNALPRIVSDVPY
jgi:hypothetical protein